MLVGDGAAGRGGIHPSYMQNLSFVPLSFVFNLVGAWAYYCRRRDETILKVAGDCRGSQVGTSRVPTCGRIRD